MLTNTIPLPRSNGKVRLSTNKATQTGGAAMLYLYETTDDVTLKESLTGLNRLACFAIIATSIDNVTLDIQDPI